ncbi:MAG: methyltransferase [Agathobacter sp.]|nr:methyltransferase [Agathobacter sp.]
MEQILKELENKENIRTNLSTLRQQIKDGEKKRKLQQDMEKWKTLFLEFLKNEDAKTRKNAALLLGDLAYEPALHTLYDAYIEEKTLFVKAAYLQALAELNVTEKLPDLRDTLQQLLEMEVEPENKKHIDEEIRALRKIIIQNEGISRHTADFKGKKVSVILLTNRIQRETIRRTVEDGIATLHPLGVHVETEHLEKLLKLRTYRDMVFPLHVDGFLPADAQKAAQGIMDAGVLELLDSLHKEDGEFYFRIEVKSAMDLEARSTFTRKLAGELEYLSKGRLINSTSDYEVEIRLIANKDGLFFPCLRLATIKNNRFAYRKNTIATSIHPSTAALIMELSKDYLKENAQIIDPFCGVGTMLIERNKKVPAREIYGTDIFGEAIVYARENTEFAGAKVNYIHRDFFDFKHDYVFDEIVTNMPLRGKKTKQEMDDFYRDFFEKAKEILAKEAVIIMYTNEIGFVKKQLRLQKNYTILQETCMQPKNDFYLLILGYKG